MVSGFLAVHRENAEDLLEESLPLLLARKLRYAELLDFCDNYRIKGIVHLLLEAEPENLHRNLYNSARAFLFGLEATPPEGIVASTAAPLFDAMACDDLIGATSIARALHPTWHPEVEYEDDFLYVNFICQRFLLAAPEGDVKALLERFEAAAVPADPRLLICRAFESRDGRGFAAGFHGFLQGYQERHRSLIDAGRISDEAAATLPYFCAEGLALLRLAERAGLPVESEYPLVPSMARGDFTRLFQENAWQVPRAR